MLYLPVRTYSSRLLLQHPPAASLVDHDVNYLIRRAMIPNFGARIGHFFSSLALAMFLLAMVSNALSTAPELQNISFSYFVPQFDGTNWAATVFILKNMS